MLYFEEIKTIEELKQRYKKLALQNHPDRGGSTEIMQEINKQYAFAVSNFVNNADQNKTIDEIISESEFYQMAIKEVMKMEGVVLELVGAWLWVTGNTRRYKEELKKAAFKYAPKKQAWYFRTEEFRVSKKGKADLSLNDIKDKYGSKIFSKTNLIR